MASIFTGGEQATAFGAETGAMDGAGMDTGAMDHGIDGAVDGGFNGGVDGGFDGGNAGGNVRPGDWSCPSCGINNFASRIKCFKCGTPKPGTEGEPGGFVGGFGGGGGGGGSGNGNVSSASTAGDSAPARSATTTAAPMLLTPSIDPLSSPQWGGGSTIDEAELDELAQFLDQPPLGRVTSFGSEASTSTADLWRND